MRQWILVDHTKDAPVVRYTRQKLLDALAARQIPITIVHAWLGPIDRPTLFIGKACESGIAPLLEEAPIAKESYYLGSHGLARIAAGFDDRGLAYALYELAERIEADSEAALLNLATENAAPDVAIRGVDRFVANTVDQSWWANPSYWRDFLDQMLSARWNRLTLIVGFDTAYLSPPYPFFVDVPGYPDVAIHGDAGLSRAEHLAALRRLGQLCHDYGMDFCFAIWQQIPWQTDQQRMVLGLENTDQLMDYCAAGVKTLILSVPEMDCLQFRVNHESGVGTQVTAEEYWFRQIDAVAAAKAEGREVQLELRAKGLTDPMIERAKSQGLDLIVSTKYCCEHAGLPHHLTRMRTEELTRLWNFNHSRRYSYADMLKKPRLHKFVYRLWNDGSTDLFTWGDPDYVRRFMRSLDLGPANGFEVMPPLSMKGGQQFTAHTGWDLFDDPAYQPLRWEDDRYWLFYRLFGRIGYQIDCAPSAWLRPMAKRFGAAALPLLTAVSAASRLLPFIVGFHMPAHPQLCYWPELSTGAALFPDNNRSPSFKRSGITYQKSEPSEAGLFYPIHLYVTDRAAGKLDGKLTPWQVISYLRGIVSQTSRSLAEAQAQGLPEGWEAIGVVLDLNMLMALADFHIHKIVAALGLSMWEELQDGSALKEALAEMQAAKTAWCRLAGLGSGAYHDNLLMGVGPQRDRLGSWKDCLPEIDQDLRMLGALADRHATQEAPQLRGACVTPMPWSMDVPKRCPAGAPLTLTLMVDVTCAMAGAPRLRYRHTNQLEGEFKRLIMQRTEDGWQATIPGEEIVPEWDLLIYAEATTEDGDGLQWPGLYHPAYPMPYHIVVVA